MKCNFPDCNELAEKHWALVPLCEQHYEDIRNETGRYYRRLMKYSERAAYLKIAHLIPWSRVSQGTVNIK